MSSSNTSYFHGFERCPIFEEFEHRLNGLEKWYELAIRPESCHLSDLDLFQQESDDLEKLRERCDEVRDLMNRALPPIEIIEKRDKYLVPEKSQIEGAGLGLFYQGDRGIILPAGTTICYYMGHLHNFRSSKKLKDKSYLMMIAKDLLVDPGPCPAIKARFINDPLNQEVVNCRYFTIGDWTWRSAVVTTRDIQPGEELLASYGDIYWSQQTIAGRTFTPKEFYS